jgi:hypothetical protein
LLDGDNRLTPNLKSLVSNRFTHLVSLVIKSYKANDIRFRNVDKIIDDIEAKKLKLELQKEKKIEALKKLTAKLEKAKLAVENAST